jgi:phosphohistidine phosphatase SixA
VKNITILERCYGNVERCPEVFNSRPPKKRVTMRTSIASLALCLAVSLHGSTVIAQTASTAVNTTVILVRHAERANGEGDVPISAEGRERAQALAVLLRDTEIATIITSPLMRTKQTAEPVAQQKRIDPEVLPADNPDAVVDRIRSRPGSTVLVVHHSNTVPILVEKLGGRSTPIKDDEFDRLVAVTISPQGAVSVVTLRYGPPSGR